MKKIAIMAGLMLASSVALAAPAAGTWGVGIAHDNGGNDNATIYVPYGLGNDMWVEPFLSYSHDKSGGAKTNDVGVGVGLFQDFYTTDKTAAYVGARVGYSYQNTKGAGHQNGVKFAPTLGFAFAPVSNFQLGGEAYVQYQYLGGTHGYARDSAVDTGTRLFVRYFFGQ